MSVTSQNINLFNDYEGFVEKFKPKLTTDDCYTPPLVYQAVADWVADNYGVGKERFVRPFYPGGDYENYDYSDGIVVDNPPFSILSKIINFYIANGIKFFLFAPTLSGLVRYSDFCTALPIGVDITYENGAVIPTSFCTNLEPHEIRMKTAPSLYATVKKANDENRKQSTKTLPKYCYPPQLITSAQIYPFNKYGIELTIPRAESERVSRLDAQKHNKKQIFGCGLLLSERLTAEREKAERLTAEREKAERLTAEREKAEREKAERYQLSDRELELIKMLSKSSQ